MADRKTWLIFLSVTAHFAIVAAQGGDEAFQHIRCSNAANYSGGYKDDLTSLLASLSSDINNTGFHSASGGAAYAIALCRADVQLDTCRSCIKNSSGDVLAGPCSNKIWAIVWQNLCMVRFANQPIFGKLGTEPHANDSNDIAFNVQPPVVNVRSMLIEDLRFKAANGGALRKAAAANRSVGDVDDTTVYAMVQCTPDLSPEDCANCTADAVRQIGQFSLPYIRFYKPSCSIRFDTDPFYDLAKLEEPLEPPPGSSPPGGHGDGHTTRNIIIIVISIVVFLLAASFVGLFVRKRIWPKKKGETKNKDEIISVESIHYDYGKIKAATNDFDDANCKLGEGAFGTVYKGTLENGREIAVKKLDQNSWQGDQEFKNEVLLLVNLQHKNLVKLLGFALEGNEKLLIYELVENRSLDHFIFDRAKSSILDWDKRYKIVGGIARGLVYLHEESSIQVIHRDLKASNVLLDKDMNPKISDFGLAKLVVPDAPHDRASRIVGTSGYMAPEYKSNGNFSIKSDVYSFGVLVLEIVTGQKIEDNSGDLIKNAWRCWREDATAEIIDRVLKETCGVQDSMVHCIRIALSSIQTEPDRRPTMVQVVQTLNTTSPQQTLPLPSEPFFIRSDQFSEDHLRN